MKRREFLKSTAMVTAATAATTATTMVSPVEAATHRAKVRSYNRLGSTDIKMSDISYGAGRLPSASMVLRAIQRGINYFDTAPDYGPSEDHIGEALKRHGQRDKIVIASKYCHPISYQSGKSHLQVGSGVDEYISAVENSLKRMGTDYLDIVFVHAIGEKPDYEHERDRLLDPDMLEATERLKEAGKIKYLAVSSHGPHNMETLMLDAVRSGKFDVIMPAFNFMKFPRVPDVLKEAHQRGVGVVAMKTLAGAKDGGISGEGTFEHAAFKWVLQHQEVAGLVISIKTVRDLDLYLAASGERFTASDQRVLDHYAARFGNEYCRTGCGDCESSCPEGVSIASILRYQMYFQDYGDEKHAMRSYAALDRKGQAEVCLSCQSAVCSGSCEHGLPLAAKLQAAHRDLSFSV
ncbi:MAG: aldo/keto reductase [Magnetococcales bacterium]|nr:aldo/keto reductase [Magnetococcales bacterium]